MIGLLAVKLSSVAISGCRMLHNMPENVYKFSISKSIIGFCLGYLALSRLRNSPACDFSRQLSGRHVMNDVSQQCPFISLVFRLHQCSGQIQSELFSLLFFYWMNLGEFGFSAETMIVV